MAKWKMHRYSIIILEVSSAKLITMMLQIKLEMFNQNQIITLQILHILPWKLKHTEKDKSTEKIGLNLSSHWKLGLAVLRVDIFSHLLACSAGLLKGWMVCKPW